MCKQKMLVMVGSLFILSVLGCNLPIKATPTPIVVPIQQETATQLAVTTPELTPIHIQTATAEPESPTPLPPATLPPTATATSVPAVPTATQTSVPPTATPIPPTATIPFSRAAPIAKAFFMPTPPVIDGDWNDLPKASEEPARFVVFGKANWKGNEDLSASFRVGWDNNYLYLGVKVNDDLYVQESSGKNLYKGDSIEILLDANVRGDYYVQALSADDYQLGISPGNPTPGKNMEAYLWYPASQAGTRTDIKMAAISSPGTYRVEIAIPWKMFGITPSTGTHFGFAVSASDNDTPGKPGQKAMVSSTPKRILTDPTTWGDLTLSR
jgi:hypothetical protein